MRAHRHDRVRRVHGRPGHELRHRRRRLRDLAVEEQRRIAPLVLHGRHLRPGRQAHASSPAADRQQVGRQMRCSARCPQQPTQARAIDCRTGHMRVAGSSSRRQLAWDAAALPPTIRACADGAEAEDASPCSADPAAPTGPARAQARGTTGRRRGAHRLEAASEQQLLPLRDRRPQAVRALVGELPALLVQAPQQRRHHVGHLEKHEEAAVHKRLVHVGERLCARRAGASLSSGLGHARAVVRTQPSSMVGMVSTRAAHACMGLALLDGTLQKRSSNAPPRPQACMCFFPCCTV